MATLRAHVGEGKRHRRPGGHPAKRAARRERQRSARPRGPDGGGLGRTARLVCSEAAALGSALEAELWASGLLGTLWSQRFNLRPEEIEDYGLVFGGPLVEAVARLGGAGARVALGMIQRVDDAELGLRAGELARRIDTGHPPLPGWIAGVGDAEIERTAVMREDVFDDGFTVFVEARHLDGERHAVGVYIDNNLGVMAKDILLADSIERVEQIMRDKPDPDGKLRMEPLEPGVVAGQIHAAMELTDITLGPPVGEDYAGLRALALLRADELPGPYATPERPEVSAEQREQLRHDFLSAPEGRGFDPGGDEAYVASLAIDFCADYVDGRPLRWSPVVVELFMADWIPRKVLAGPELLGSVPAALDAWVRFAGRARGSPDWAIERTCEAIPHWREEMVERAGDPDAGGPGKQFLIAAKEAGIDLADEAALRTFIAGW